MAPRTSGPVAQNQIDAVIQNGAPAAASRADADPLVYDFRRPHRASKERLRAIEVMYERLGKSVEGWLMARVRGHVEVRLQSAEQISFGEYSGFLSSPCCSYLVAIKDAGGQQGVVDFGTEMAFFLVDRLLGGGAEPAILDRALSPIERMALRVVADRVVNQLQDIWHEHEDLQLSIDGFESVPETLQAVDREDPVLVVTFGVTFGEKTSTFSICLPLGVLETFFVVATGGRKGNLTSLGSEKELLANRFNTEAQVRKTSVNLRVRLPDFQVSLRELAALTEGSVLRTGTTSDAPLLAFIGPTPRFHCSAGWVGRTLAIRVLDTIDASGADALPLVQAS